MILLAGLMALPFTLGLVTANILPVVAIYWPVVFLLVTLFMMYYLLIGRPLQSFLGVLIMLSGLAIYAVFRKRADVNSAASSNRE